MRKFLLVISLVLSAVTLSAQDAMIVSKLGGKCLDVEGGTSVGARLIGFQCHGGSNQKFRFERGRLVVGGLCAQATGRGEGSEVKLAPCNFTPAGDSLQNFASWEGKYIGHNSGYVLDLKGGAGHWWGNQPVVLWTKHGGANQSWMRGQMTTQAGLRSYSGTAFVAGKVGSVTFSGGRAISENGAGLITDNGAGIVTDNGAGIIAASRLP